MRHLGKAVILLLTAGSAAASAAQAPITGERPAAAKPFTATQLASFDSPWAMTFLPDGEILVTEKAGKLLLLSADRKSVV